MKLGDSWQLHKGNFLNTVRVGWLPIMYNKFIAMKPLDKRKQATWGVGGACGYVTDVWGCNPKTPEGTQKVQEEDYQVQL